MGFSLAGDLCYCKSSGTIRIYYAGCRLKIIFDTVIECGKENFFMASILHNLLDISISANRKYSVMKKINCLFLTAACLICLPAFRKNSPITFVNSTICKHIEIANNIFHFSYDYDDDGRLTHIINSTSHNKTEHNYSYDANGHLKDIPGILKATYNNKNGKLDQVIVTYNNSTDTIAFVDNDVELVTSMDKQDAGVYSITKSVYAYGNKTPKGNDPISIQSKTDTYRDGKHETTSDDMFSITYAPDKIIMYNSNPVNRFICVSPFTIGLPTGSIIPEQHLPAHMEISSVLTEDGKKLPPIKMSMDFSYTYDSAGRPVTVSRSKTVNGHKMKTDLFVITYTCN